MMNASDLTTIWVKRSLGGLSETAEPFQGGRCGLTGAMVESIEAKLVSCRLNVTRLVGIEDGKWITIGNSSPTRIEFHFVFLGRGDDEHRIGIPEQSDNPSNGSLYFDAEYARTSPTEEVNVLSSIVHDCIHTVVATLDFIREGIMLANAVNLGLMSDLKSEPKLKYFLPIG